MVAAEALGTKAATAVGQKVVTLLFDDLKKRKHEKEVTERAAQAFKTSWETAIDRVRYVDCTLPVLSELMNLTCFVRQISRIEEQSPCEPDYEFDLLWAEYQTPESTRREIHQEDETERRLRTRAIYLGFLAVLERRMYELFEDDSQRRSMGRVVHELHAVQRKVSDMQSTLLAIVVAAVVYLIVDPTLEAIPGLLQLTWPGVDEVGAATVASLISLAAKRFGFPPKPSAV